MYMTGFIQKIHPKKKTESVEAFFGIEKMWHFSRLVRLDRDNQNKIKLYDLLLYYC